MTFVMLRTYFLNKSEIYGLAQLSFEPEAHQGGAKRWSSTNAKSPANARLLDLVHENGNFPNQLFEVFDQWSQLLKHTSLYGQSSVYP